MKKILAIGILLTLMVHCSKKEDSTTVIQPPVLLAKQTIPNHYVVLVKESKIKPIIKDGKRTDPNRKQQKQLNDNARNTKKTEVKAIATRNGVTLSDREIFTDVSVGFAKRLTTTQLADLNGDNDVMVFEDFRISLRDPIHQSEPIPQRDPIHQDYFYDINAGITCAVNIAGGPKANGGSKNTRVWILDTGVQEHDDLNVETDTALAKSFIPGDLNSNDYNGHGTHVAGIIGGISNPFGVTGVSENARVIPVKVLEHSGVGSWSYLIAGLNHVAKYNQENDVVNLSLGGYDLNNCKNSDPEFKELRKMIQDLASDKTFVVMAAGNDSHDAQYCQPGCIDIMPNRIFTVASIECDTTCTSYSNFGKTVDYLAVGTNVFSTFINQQYRVMSGTSMATAIVSGIIHANGGKPKAGVDVSCGHPGATPPVPARRIPIAKCN